MQCMHGQGKVIVSWTLCRNLVIKNLSAGFSYGLFTMIKDSLEEASRTQCGILCAIFKSAGIQAGFPPGKFN